MGIDPTGPFTFGQYTHLLAQAIDAERGTEHMLEKAFPFFDQDGSGFITREEMVEQFQELGGLLSREEIEEFHDVLDSDGNGVIDVRCSVCRAPNAVEYFLLPITFRRDTCTRSWVRAAGHGRLFRTQATFTLLLHVQCCPGVAVLII